MVMCNQCMAIIKKGPCTRCHTAFYRRATSASSDKYGVAKINSSPESVKNWYHPWFEEETGYWKNFVGDSIKERKYALGRMRRVRLLIEKYKER